MRFLPIPGYPNYQISQDGEVKRQTGPEKFRTVQSTWDNNGHYRIITLWQDGHRDICDPDTGPVWYPVIGIRLPQGFGCVSSLRLYRWQNGSGVSYDWECQIRITQYRNMNEKTMIVIVTKDNWYVK